MKRTNTEMMTLDEFLASPWNLVVYHDRDIAFQSQAHELRALVEYLTTSEISDSTSISFYDKIVGRAAALLMMLHRPCRVVTGVLNDGAHELLSQHGIEIVAKKRIHRLTEAGVEGLCRWEKLSVGKSSEALLHELSSIYRREAN